MVIKKHQIPINIIKERSLTRFLKVMNTQTIVRSPLRLSLLGGGTDIPHIINKLNKAKIFIDE